MNLHRDGRPQGRRRYVLCCDRELTFYSTIISAGKRSLQAWKSPDRTSGTTVSGAGEGAGTGNPATPLPSRASWWLLPIPSAPRRGPGTLGVRPTAPALGQRSEVNGRVSLPHVASGPHSMSSFERQSREQRHLERVLPWPEVERRKITGTTPLNLRSSSSCHTQAHGVVVPLVPRGEEHRALPPRNTLNPQTAGRGGGQGAQDPAGLSGNTRPGHS